MWPANLVWYRIVRGENGLPDLVCAETQKSQSPAEVGEALDEPMPPDSHPGKERHCDDYTSIPQDSRPSAKSQPR
jgi:hypothetical protein